VGRAQAAAVGEAGVNLHIAIDAHSVGSRLGGNESYITSLIEALAEIDQANQYTIYVTKREAVERFGKRWPNVTTRLTLPHTPLIRVPLTLTAELRRRPVDLLHVQYTSPPFTRCPVVATIHDISFEHIPRTFRRRSVAQFRLTIRRTARSAAHIIAPSEYSRMDLLQTYGLDPAKVSVTPLAAAPSFGPSNDETETQRLRQVYDVKADYILSVGSIQPRKNLNRLIDAYANLRRTRSQAKLPQLLLVGERGWLCADTLEAVEKHGIDGDIRFTGYVPERDLRVLYANALCFVYPSYFEGFGLPPLEAMQCGAPVIAGNLTSLPEVIGDAGLLIDPFDQGEFVSALARMIDDGELRARLRVKGLERSKTFDWRETARLTLEIYQRSVQAGIVSSNSGPGM
jgi:glycosyltransferase involved in cell wall biosynthesis